MASRRQRTLHRGPYLAAVPARIADVDVVLPGDLAAELDDASGEIARFDADLGRELAPFAVVLLRSEAAASSQIEDLTASARALAEAELEPSSARANPRQIVANTAAMRAALALADHVTADGVLAMHDALMRDVDPSIAGRWREGQVWVGGGSLGPHSAAFVAPHHDLVPEAIDDLVRFLARDDVPVLAHAAIAHAQFETIHPFPDGNGRTGRALVHALLRAKGLTRNVTVPVSAGLLMDTSSYFAALTAYRDGDLAPLLSSFVHAAFAAIANGRALAERLVVIREGWSQVVPARRNSGTWRIADVLLRQPVVNARYLATELGIAMPNVYAPLRPLLDAGVVVETQDRQRSRVWRAPEVLAAVDEFAARARRSPV